MSADTVEPNPSTAEAPLLRKRWVVGVTGASGVRYGLRLIQQLSMRLSQVDVVVSDAALRVMREEEGIKASRSSLSADLLWTAAGSSPMPVGNERVVFHSPQDIGAEIASGSCLFEGMVIVPCSMSTLGAIASGAHSHLIHRVADVVLKERRRLIVVPRETPLSLIHLRNLVTLAEAGAEVLPAMPGFYHCPTTIQELVDMLVMKIMDRMGVHIDLVQRWKQAE